jgi:hypothetical protein
MSQKFSAGETVLLGTASIALVLSIAMAVVLVLD